MLKCSTELFSFPSKLVLCQLCQLEIIMQWVPFCKMEYKKDSVCSNLVLTINIKQANKFQLQKIMAENRTLCTEFSCYHFVSVTLERCCSTCLYALGPVLHQIARNRSTWDKRFGGIKPERNCKCTCNCEIRVSAGRNVSERVQWLVNLTRTKEDLWKALWMIMWILQCTLYCATGWSNSGYKQWLYTASVGFH